MSHRSTRRRVLLLVALLTVIARGLLTLSRMDEVELEVYSGSIAGAILAGMPLDPTQLPIIVHLRGSYLVGLMLVPMFAVFGATLWALKALALAWTLATVYLWVLVLDRVLGWRAALAGGLAYVFLPPSFQMVDVTLLGSHGETILFIMAALWFLVTRKESLLLHRGQGLVFGALMGLGFLFSMQFLAVIPALIIAWWLHEAKLVRDGSTLQGSTAWTACRESLLFGLPLLVLAVVGLKFMGSFDVIPMWWLFALVGVIFCGLAIGIARVRALVILGGFFLAAAPTAYITRSTVVVNQALEDHILPGGVSGFFAKFFDVVTSLFAKTWLFQNFGGVALMYLFGAGMLVGLGFTVKRALRGEALPAFLLLQPFFFFCLYAVTNLELRIDVPLDGMGSRYVMPVLACMTGWIAIAASDLWRSRHEALGAAVLVAPVTAGFIALVPMLEPSIAFEQPMPRGDRFHYFGVHFAYAGGERLAERLKWVETVDPDWAAFRPGYYRETFLNDKSTPKGQKEILSRLNVALQIPGELGAHVMFNLGAYAYESKVMRNRSTAELIADGLAIEEWWERTRGESHERHHDQGHHAKRELEASIGTADMAEMATIANPSQPRDRDPSGEWGQDWKTSATESAPEPESNAVWFARGYGATGLWTLFFEREVLLINQDFNAAQFMDTVPDAWRGYVAQGAGFLNGDKLTAFNIQPLRYMRMCDRELVGKDRENYFMGLGLGFRTHYQEATYWVPDPFALRIERMLSEDARLAFRKGLEAPLDRFPTPR